ncbi:MAG: serine/threonine protein kinase [Chloroflexi bacterium]|nr:MAG: serine/threonine protein kinase [Chloroflexota bacterium]
MIQEQMTLPLGATLQDDHGGHYCVEQLLGRGESSAVYLVSERRNKHWMFALKEVINPRTQDRKRLLFEYELLKRLTHPALPRVYYAFEQAELKRVYLLMEYIKGKDLDVLRNEQPGNRFPLQSVLMLLDPIVDALVYLHQQEPPILHRDIKPANIIVPPDGRSAALVDFRMAKEYQAESTTTVFRRGTPGYAAIEQFGNESDTDVRTDVYGLGATLYTLLTGVKPVNAVKRLLAEKRDDPLKPAHVLVPDIPQPVSQALQRALSLQPEDRFATVGDFWNALHADTDTGKQEEQAPVLPTSGTGKQGKTRSGRRKRIAVFSLALLVLVVGGLGLLLSFTHPAALTSIIGQTSSRGAVLPSTSSRTRSFPYPPIASSYAGTISDTGVTNKKTTLYLGQMLQDRKSIAGNFQGLGLVGSLTGTVTPFGRVHFIVKYGAESLILDGEMKAGGDIEGTFYALDQHGQNLGKYGQWSVSAASSSS